MNTVMNILKVLAKIVMEIIRAFFKVIRVMIVLFFSIAFGTKQSNKWQYDAEYYGYE